MSSGANLASPPSDPKFLLAVDAGFANLGWAIINISLGSVMDFGVIVTEKSDKKRGIRVADDNAERCQTTARALRNVIHKWNPSGAVVELPHGGAQNARSMRDMGIATGVICSVLEVLGIPSEFTTPVAGKIAATGNKQASKEEVIADISSRYPSIDWTKVKNAKREHVADAVAAYLAAENGILCRTLRGPNAMRA